MSRDEDRLQSPALSDVSGSPNSSPEPGSKKRKHVEEAKPVSKRAAKRKKSKPVRDPLDEALDLEHGVNHAIGHMDPQLLADHIAQRNRRHQSDLSSVEQEDLRISASAIHDTTDWRQTRDKESLPKFLEHFASNDGKDKEADLKKAPKAQGSPHTLVVAGAGLRAADLTRALRSFQTKEAKVEKLFAKHIKLKEAIDTVKKTRINIGVGTPQRIIDLLEDGALKSKSLKRIVVDTSHIDVKKRGILDMRETLVPLMNLLKRDEFTTRYENDEDKVQLLFF
ncbi:CMS1-like protein [Elsinoe fawcettii]|nr:CMS1-like protein [Elsinoe fawcettii]